MRMNHVNLSVPDVQKTRVFFETYFGLRFVESPISQKIVVALDENDSLIALSNFSGASEYSYPAAFHVGFNLPSREAVDALHERLTAGGYKACKRTDFHMAWTFYVEAPGGFLVEVFHQSGMAQLKAALANADSGASASPAPAARP